jgi:two-component system NtrC family response regulator
MVILVVDDDELVRRVVTEMLEDCDFSVIEAGSGGEALAMTREQTDVDLVISDVNMPGMDGLQLISELKSIRPSLPVILMSGRPYRDRTHPFLAKPFTRQALLACITGARAHLSGAEKHSPPPP